MTKYTFDIVMHDITEDKEVVHVYSCESSEYYFAFQHAVTYAFNQSDSDHEVTSVTINSMVNTKI